MSARTAAVLATVAVLAALFVPASLSGQRGHEWQVGAVATVADASYVGGGGGFALRDGRARLSVVATGGVLNDGAAARGEVLLGFLLTPSRRRGPGLYFGGGVAVVASSGGTVERLVATVGLESAPGGRLGWYLEAGAGGGVRLAAGVRLRRVTRR